MIDSVAAGITCAMPNPRNEVIAMTWNTELFVWNEDMANKVPVTTSMPKTTTSLLPNRWTQRVERGAKNIMRMACGTSIAPAFIVE